MISQEFGSFVHTFYHSNITITIPAWLFGSSPSAPQAAAGHCRAAHNTQRLAASFPPKPKATFCRAIEHQTFDVDCLGPTCLAPGAATIAMAADQSGQAGRSNASRRPGAWLQRRFDQPLCIHADAFAPPHKPH